MSKNITELDCKVQKKIRITYFTHYSKLYGANRSLLEMLQDLQHHRIEPIVITPVYGEINEELDKMNIENKVFYFRPWVYSLNDSFVKKILKLLILHTVNYFSCRNICSFLKREKTDLVHTNSSVINIGALVASKMNLPHIWHIREYGEEHFNIYFFYPFEKIVKYMSDKSRKIIFVSRNLMLKYAPYFDDNDKIKIIHNGATKEKYYNIKDISFASKSFKMVCCGLIHPNKNQLEILESLNILINKEKINDLKLTIIGQGDEQYLNQLYDFTERHKLQNCVHFAGYIKNIAEVVKDCDIGLVPSYKEAFGRVTIEYMLAGLPVIASNSGANPEIIDHGKTGYIYELNNPIDLSQKIKLLYNNREHLYEISKRAQEKALKEFTSDINAKKIYEVYQQIMKNKT